MNDSGAAQLGGLVFGFTIASLMVWLGVAALPFASPVARWFRARMLTARGMPPLGREAAAENMVPGQIVFAAIAAIVIGSVIVWDAGAKTAGALSATGVTVLPLLIMIFLGAAGLVGGFVVVVRGANRGSNTSRRWVVVGAMIAIAGLGCLITGIATVLCASG